MDTAVAIQDTSYCRLLLSPSAPVHKYQELCDVIVIDSLFAGLWIFVGTVKYRHPCPLSLNEYIEVELELGNKNCTPTQVSASGWFLLRRFITMHGPYNVTR